MALSDSFYKKLEQELNKRIYDQINCRTFTKAVGKVLDSHLDQVTFQRKVITHWLKRRDLANKDDLAFLAEKVIQREEKLDSLEDVLYTLNNKYKENQTKIVTLKESLEEMREVFQKEINAYKIHSLENELADLKKLFQ